MKKAILRTMFVFLCFLFMSAGSAWANLINNGSFELGNYTGANWSWERLMAGDSRLTGWIIGGAGVDWHNTAELHPSYNGDTTERMIDLNLDGGGATGTISQTVNTAAGSHYLLTFSMASPFGASVNISGAGVYDYSLFVLNTGTPLVWENKWIDFYATGSQTTITFSSLNGYSYWGPVLDNIVLVEQNVNTVPEPASMLLLGLGLASIAGLRRKFIK